MNITYQSNEKYGLNMPMPKIDYSTANMKTNECVSLSNHSILRYKLAIISSFKQIVFPRIFFD